MSKKVNLLVALAPMTRMENTKEAYFQLVGQDVDSVYWWLDYFEICELFGPTW